jgi:hypothetical protein
MPKLRDLWLSMEIPKIHGLQDHLVIMMEQWNGISEFLEDFVEQEHQLGMREEKRTANMRDQVRVANLHSKGELSDKMSSDIQIAKEEVKRRPTRRVNQE